jgi:Omp85 superfamily domain
MITMIKARHACAAVLLLILEGQALGETQAAKETADTASGTEQTTASAESEQTAAAEKRGELAVAPIPVIDPTIGNGLAAVAVYTVRLKEEDKVSPPSVFGAGGFRTSSGSWALAGGGKLYLKQDRFRILAAVATARVNYTFFGIGNETEGEGTTIPITQRGSGLLVGAQVRVFERWFVGSRYYHFNVSTGLEDGNAEIERPIEEVQFKLPVAALALHLERDTRKSQFYPRSGSVFDTKVYFSNKQVGALFNYQDYGVSFQQYFRLGERQVLAYRVKACAVNGSAPFFAICSLGNPADMRGYPVGRYRDRRMLVGQAEYRREIWWRFGFAAFAGAGQVAPTFADFKGSNTRPGGGAGLRFALAPKNHINLRVDYSVGQGSHAWYVGVGEAF